MADDNEAVEDDEGDCGDGEEVHGRNRFPVIRRKARQRWAGWGSIGNRFIQRETLRSET